VLRLESAPPDSVLLDTSDATDAHIVAQPPKIRMTMPITTQGQIFRFFGGG
jgi:hypothetical protein